MERPHPPWPATVARLTRGLGWTADDDNKDILSLRLAVLGALPDTNLPLGVPLYCSLSSTTWCVCMSIPASSRPLETAPVFVFTNLRRTPTNQTVSPSPIVRRLTYIRLNHPLPSSVSPAKLQPNENGENDKLEGMPPDCCKMNGSCRGRRDPPGCFGAGVVLVFEGDLTRRREGSKDEGGGGVGEKTMGRLTLGAGVSDSDG